MINWLWNTAQITTMAEDLYLIQTHQAQIQVSLTLVLTSVIVSVLIPSPVSRGQRPAFGTTSWRCLMVASLAQRRSLQSMQMG